MLSSFHFIPRGVCLARFKCVRLLSSARFSKQIKLTCLDEEKTFCIVTASIEFLHFISAV